ncbi:glycosyltransferase family 4 protein [Roseovarius arcticus]|uniref:glycosyltransferase family 4 protein n=1 Tax=Roseovarius arcticus TaxID=2547404 RepID=UPI001BB1CF9C|nr:glycosyltransferase family 4 protein [Roseovarius arcticus]
MMMLANPPNLPLIAFVDPCCAGGYDLADLEKSGLGGTEATVLRVATALRFRFRVTHYQAGRSDSIRSDAGDLRPLDHLRQARAADAIVVLNRWKVAAKLRKLYPGTPIFLWLHVYPGRHNRAMGAVMKDADITVICVSRTHVRSLATFTRTSDRPDITFIYNPVADGLRPDGSTRDADKLLFASSPHKGLGQVFEQFAALRLSIPSITLAVADPGYLKWDTGAVPDGVSFLGALPHHVLVQHMRQALCLFNPQTSFAETFGLVLAEANAVGTPVLIHEGLGANDEVVADEAQRVDGNDPEAILKKIAQWRHSCPAVTTNPEFNMAEVANVWAELLQSAVKRTPSGAASYSLAQGIR